MADLSITAAQVLEGTIAEIESGTAGEAVTAGQAGYMDTTVGKYKLADANNTAATAVTKIIFLNSAAADQPVKGVKEGTITLGADASVIEGTVYVLSDTPGGIAPAADLATGWNVSVLGVGNDSDGLEVKINNSGATVPA